MQLAIDLHDVAKVYRGRVHALQGIEMRVARGEVFGLLGPNGAGKSTLVKIMMTVIRPTRAVGTILGHPVGHKPTLQRVGYLPENHRFPRYLTGRQTLEFFGSLAKVDRVTRRKRAGELLDIVGMTAWADRKVGTYSKGMMQRVGIGQALMSDPDLVVLDEPTDGVDPVGRRDIRDVLHRIRDQGKTVFINSHLLSELEMMCNRVAILVQGRVARQGTIDELTAKSQRYDIELDATGQPPDRVAEVVGGALGVVMVAEPPPPPGTPGAFPPMQTPHPAMPPPPFGGPPHLHVPQHASAVPLPVWRSRLADGTWLELRGSLLSVGTADALAIQPLIDALRGANLTIRRLTPVRQSLEDLFMEAVTDPTTGVALAPGASRPFAKGGAR